MDSNLVTVHFVLCALANFNFAILFRRYCCSLIVLILLVENPLAIIQPIQFDEQVHSKYQAHKLARMISHQLMNKYLIKLFFRKKISISKQTPENSIGGKMNFSINRCRQSSQEVKASKKDSLNCFQEIQALQMTQEVASQQPVQFLHKGVKLRRE